MHNFCELWFSCPLKKMDLCVRLKHFSVFAHLTDLGVCSCETRFSLGGEKKVSVMNKKDKEPKTVFFCLRQHFCLYIFWTETTMVNKLLGSKFSTKIFKICFCVVVNEVKKENLYLFLVDFLKSSGHIL